MTGQWIYEDLAQSRHRRAAAARRCLSLAVADGPRKIARGLRRARRKFHGAAQRAVRQSGLNDNATTHTLSMGIQMIKPGEIAWAHRHTLAAIRFVIKGDGKVFTVVDGEKCPMEPYDLILTPQWTWHDHQQSDPRKRDLGRCARCAVFARPESAVLRTLSRQQSSGDAGKTERTFAAARRRRAADMGKLQERKSAAALRLERYRAAIARARRSARAAPMTAWRWNMSIR